MDETTPLLGGLGHVEELQPTVDRPMVEFDPNGDPENRKLELQCV
jgi:hypothetical protein